MRAPTVHLNGTGKASLLDAAKDARRAVHEARNLLQPVAPNGRDYYPQDQARDSGVAQRVAFDEWLSMDLKLRDVEQELTQLVIDIENQGKR